MFKIKSIFYKIHGKYYSAGINIVDIQNCHAIIPRKQTPYGDYEFTFILKPIFFLI